MNEFLAMSSRFSKYQPSGKVSWLRLVPWLAMSLGVAWLIADAGFRAERLGVYPPIVGSAICSVLAASLAAGVIRWSHCRNPMIGATVGVALTLFAFLAFFQISLLDARSRGSVDGLANASWTEVVSGVADYIQLRWKNVRGGESADFATMQGRMAIFIVECALALVLGLVVGRKASLLPFSETHRQWLKPTWTFLKNGSGLELLRFLSDETLAMPSAVPRNQAGAAARSYSLIGGGEPIVLDLWDGSQTPNRLLRQAVLTPEADRRFRDWMNTNSASPQPA